MNVKLIDVFPIIFIENGIEIFRIFKTKGNSFSLNFSIAKRAKRSKYHNFDRSYHRSCTRHSSNLRRSMSVTYMDQEMFDDDNPVHQPSMSSSTTNNSGELSEANHRMDDDDEEEEEEEEEDEDYVQDIHSLSTLNSPQSKNPKLSLLNHRQPNLLSIREHIQKGINILLKFIMH